MDEVKLKSELNKLSSLSSEILLILFKEKGRTEDYYNYLDRYKKLKAEILLELTKNFKIPKVTDPALRSELKAYLKHGDYIVSELKKDSDESGRKFFKSIEKELKPEFSDERIRELEDSLFYIWFSGYDYVYRLINTASIVIKNIDFPEKLESLINELRHCLIFENYLAAGIILRTVAEVAVEDVIEKNFGKKDFNSLEEKLLFLAGKSSFTESASILNAYRRELNKYVHGQKLMKSKFVDGYVEIILAQIEQLYEAVE